MLSIKSIGHTEGHVNYYANLGSAENHDYYSEDGIRPGRWWGVGAAALGLEGAVAPKVFTNVLQGMSPDGKRKLVQTSGSGTRKRRAGFDLTWSVPKSLSVLWSQLPDSDRVVLDELMERALHRSLEAYVELCGVARRGKDGYRLEDAKPVIAVFSHDTARATPGEAPDANRHFHAVVANVCVRPDGTTGAVDSRVLFQRRMKMALGAMFRAELAKLLQKELGLVSYRPERGRKKKLASWFELQGIPESVVTAMSKRRKAIEKWLKEHGLSDAKSAEKAAVRTRKEKEHHSWQQLNDAWSKLGLEHGFGVEQAAALLGGPSLLPPSEMEDIGKAAVSELVEKKARFTENEVLEVAAVKAQTNGVGIDEILASVRSTLSNQVEAIRLDDARGVKAYSTQQMIDTEKRMLRTAQRLSKNTLHPVKSETVLTAINEASTLRPQQNRCVWAIAQGGDVVSVTGIAGSGKTFALRVARVAFERSGYSVIGTALASKAAQGLEAGSGIKSTHLHSLFASIERGELELSERSVIVVDEAGMIGTVMMDKLLSLAESTRAKVALVGDHLQLQAIDAGAPFRIVSEGIGTTELTEIIRQRESWARKSVIDFRSGRASEALTSLHRRGQLKLSADADATIKTVVRDWKALLDSGKGTAENTMVLAGTNLLTEEVNRQLQGVLRERGDLGEHSVELDGTSFHLGDRVLITKNHRLLGLRNGTLAEVVGAWDSVLAIRTENGFEVEIDTNEFSDLDLAYAMNTHKGQGVSTENALFIAEPSMVDREMAYVAASRAKGTTLVYSDKEAVADIEELAELMSNSNQKEMATEYLRLENL